MGGVHSAWECHQQLICDRKLLITACFTSILKVFLKKSSTVRSSVLKTYTHMQTKPGSSLWFSLAVFRYCFYFFTGKGWNVSGNVAEGCHATLRNIFCYSSSCVESKSKWNEFFCCSWTWIRDICMEGFCLHKAALNSFYWNWASYLKQRYFVLGFSMRYQRDHLMAYVFFFPGCRVYHFSYTLVLILAKHVCGWNFILIWEKYQSGVCVHVYKYKN